MIEHREKYITNRRLATLPNGDEAYIYEKCIAVIFQGKRRLISTSDYGGGCREDCLAVFNYDGKADDNGQTMAERTVTYLERLKRVAENLGLDPSRTTGMETAADMECAAVVSESYKELAVSAIVTAGIEVNGGRVGEPADYYEPLPKGGNASSHALGTINIILSLDADMSAGTLARALVTCTEAKTAAIQELMADSRYSWGLATGSGTDQTVIIANIDSPLYLDGAGKHSKLGELIGRVVMRAVKEALDKQSGLNPALQHDALRRLRRFGVASEELYRLFRKKSVSSLIKPEFLLAADALSRDAAMLTYSSLYAHLLDQFVWGLIDREEMQLAGKKLLDILALHYGAAAVALPDNTDGEKKTAVKLMTAAWEDLFSEIINLRNRRENEG